MHNFGYRQTSIDIHQNLLLHCSICETEQLPYNMPRNTIFTRHADILAAKLERQFPRVERVAPLVVDAIAAVEQTNTSAKALDGTGLNQ